MTHALCVTGGIGSGKSCVARLLAGYCNVPLIDIDACCKDLLVPGRPGWLAVQGAFGSTFFTPDGHVDRPRLRAELFANPGLRVELDALLHPIARDRLRNEIAQYEQTMLFVEVPLVFEAGWEDDFAAITVVTAGPAVQVSRTRERDGVSGQQVKQSIEAQMTLEKKVALADYVIDNNGSWTDTRVKVVELGLLLEKKFGCLSKKNLTLTPIPNN
ncbi:MAG: dephospho-CoA kinase [Desulfobulbus propionicus]|nr:MAG: dephospho-CoA kinase [Desulfobulbus propionicus]